MREYMNSNYGVEEEEKKNGYQYAQTFLNDTNNKRENKKPGRIRDFLHIDTLAQHRNTDEQITPCALSPGRDGEEKVGHIREKHPTGSDTGIWSIHKIGERF